MTEDRLRTAGLERRFPISDDRSISSKLVLPQCNGRETIRLGSRLVTRRVSVNRDCFREHCLLWCRPNIYIHIHTKYVAKVIRAEWKPIMRTSSRGDR